MPKRVGGVRGSSSARWNRKLSPSARRKLNRKSRRNSAPTKKAAAAKAKTRSPKQEHRGQKSRPTSKVGKKAAARKKAKSRSQHDRRETVAFERGMRRLERQPQIPVGPNPRPKPGKSNKRRGGFTNFEKRVYKEQRQIDKTALRKVGIPGSRYSKSQKKRRMKQAMNQTKWPRNARKKLAYDAETFLRHSRQDAERKVNKFFPQQRSWNNNYGRGMR